MDSLYNFLCCFIFIVASIGLGALVFYFARNAKRSIDKKGMEEDQEIEEYSQEKKRWGVLEAGASYGKKRWLRDHIGAGKLIDEWNNLSEAERQSVIKRLHSQWDGYPQSFRESIERKYEYFNELEIAYSHLKTQQERTEFERNNRMLLETYDFPKGSDTN